MLQALTDAWEEERSAMQRELEFRFQEEVAAVAKAAATEHQDRDSEAFGGPLSCNCRQQLESFQADIRKEIEAEMQREASHEDVMAKLAWDRDRIAYEDAIKDLQCRLDAATSQSKAATGVSDNNNDAA